MKDRNLLNLLRGAMAPLVAILLLGAFWVGMKTLPRRDTSPQRPRADSPRVDLAPDQGPYESALPHARFTENHGDWLPPLSDQTRNVLNAFPSPQYPEAVGSQAGSGVGKSDAPAAPDGPLLVAPQSPLPASQPEAAHTNAFSTDAAKRSAGASIWPRLPELGSHTAVPCPLPAVAPETTGFGSRRGPSEAQSLPGQADRGSRRQAAASTDRVPAVLSPVNQGNPLPAAQTPASRSEQLELIAREADMHSRYAFQLAGRGAVYAARAELIAALRLVAQGLDGEEHTTAHSRALAAGLTALKEADDFAPGRARLEADLNLAAVTAGHRTPVLHDVPTDGLTALNAMQHYLSFCQEQLAAACGHEVAGSMTLYGLGKLHAVLANRHHEDIRAAAPKAVAFYQASLLVYSRNHMASNDLGVLLAQAGRYNEARVALEHSAAICRQEENWQNLAKVYRQLGQGQKAQNADQQLAAIRQEMSRSRQGVPTASGLVEWVDPGVLAQPGGGPRVPAQPPAPSGPAKVGNASGPAQTRTISARLPDALFEKRE